MSTSYNILCVTKRSADDKVVEFHLKADANSAVADGEVVEYNGARYPLDYTRTGLGSSAVVLGLRTPDGNILELYTDTPVEGSGATPESLRASADYMMKAEDGRLYKRP